VDADNPAWILTLINLSVVYWSPCQVEVAWAVQASPAGQEVTSHPCQPSSKWE
jgi:hypothetical protein